MWLSPPHFPLDLPAKFGVGSFILSFLALPREEIDMQNLYPNIHLATFV